MEHEVHFSRPSHSKSEDDLLEDFLVAKLVRFSALCWTVSLLAIGGRV